MQSSVLQDDLGTEGALDFGFAEDELLLANTKPPSLNFEDVVEEVRRDHDEAARSRKKREVWLLVLIVILAILANLQSNTIAANACRRRGGAASTST